MVDLFIFKFWDSQREDKKERRIDFGMCTIHEYWPLLMWFFASLFVEQLLYLSKFCTYYPLTDVNPKICGISCQIKSELNG